jgi:hypothetical protein
LENACFEVGRNMGLSVPSQSPACSPTGEFGGMGLEGYVRLGLPCIDAW